MKVRILFVLAAWLALVSAAFGQGNSCRSSNYCSGPETAQNDAVTLTLQAGSASAVVNLSGTFSGTVTFEGGVNTPDGGIVWTSATGTPVAGGTAVTTATSAGQWRFVVSGFTSFRARCSTYASGNIYATISASTGSAASSGGGSGGTTAFSSLTSGTNTSAAMVVGSGASLAPSGTGTISANQYKGTSLNRPLGYEFGSLTTGVALTSSEVGYITSPFACTITGWHIMANAGTAASPTADSGNVTIQFARVNGGTAVPTLASNSISTSGISLTTGTAVDSTTVTDFTSTAIAANDHLGIYITTVATARQVTVQLDCAQ